jgi:hypothetical protein
MNTTENNKLIAEFMGRSISPITLAEFRKLKPRDKHLVSGAFVEDLQYHSDWSSLMPVVSKCYEYGELDNHYRDQIIASLSGVIDIDDTYSACLDFVKHYNEKK